MNESQILLFLNDYGLLFVFSIVFMEYLNLPGFPSGVIMPVLGVWSVYSGHPFILILGVSVIAGVLGSLILYYVGKFGGKPLLKKLYAKHPKTGVKMKNIQDKMNINSGKTVFFAKLIPVVRTLIGFPAGVSNMKVSKYLVFSALGIVIWNGVFIVSGTAFAQFFIK